MMLPRFISKMLPGFEVIDIKEYFKKETIEVYFNKSDNPEVFPVCSRCKNFLMTWRGWKRLTEITDDWKLFNKGYG